MIVSTEKELKYKAQDVLMDLLGFCPNPDDVIIDVYYTIGIHKYLQVFYFHIKGNHRIKYMWDELEGDLKIISNQYSDNLLISEREMY